MQTVDTLPFTVTPYGATCGARVDGVDLSRPVSAETIAGLRATWLEYRVLAIADQQLTEDDVERVAGLFGPLVDDPFLAAIAGRKHVAEIRRDANETTSLFGESWHSDWSFLPQPPAMTALYGVHIPPVGGETLFADQCAAYDALDAVTQKRLEGLTAVHSAYRGYSATGRYGKPEKGRSMTIVSNDAALAPYSHPIVRLHPETGRPALFINRGYTERIDGLPEDEGAALLRELFEHQVRPEFVYRHSWEPGMLLLWDNRAVLHAATGGYEGHRRLLWRVTVGERA